MDKVAMITKNEAEATENFNKVVELCKQIAKIKKQTAENEKQANLLEVKSEQLKHECIMLEIESDLQKKQVKFLEDNVDAQIETLQGEKEQRESVQQGVLKEMTELINEVNGRTFTSGRDQALKILETRAVEKANRGLKIETLKLEGEIYALNSFKKKFQERRLAEMENLIEMKKCQVPKE